MDGVTPHTSRRSYKCLPQAQSPPPNNLPDDRSDVLVDVRRLLQIREAQAITSPDDPVNSGQISALRNLETVSTCRTPSRLGTKSRADSNIDTFAAHLDNYTHS